MTQFVAVEIIWTWMFVGAICLGARFPRLSFVAVGLGAIYTVGILLVWLGWRIREVTP